jgi:pyruvate/2-oxoglutarate dehydrogenase complex dihydrolipoamide acyltransferase (E2) component
MFKSNVALGKKMKISSWRKSAIGTWKISKDSQVYCLQTINVDSALAFLKEKPYTMTHLAAQGCAKMIQENPEVNTLIIFGKVYPRLETSIFFQVASDKEGKDLTGHVVRNIDKMNLDDIKNDLNQAGRRIKSGDDFNYKKVKSQMRLVPDILITFIINIYGFILYKLNIWSPALGAPKDAFGSMMITNIGSLGMQRAYVPLVGYSNCPLILALGKVYQRVGVKDNKPVVESVMDCCWTLDHRVLDGVVGAKMAKSFERYFLNSEFK